MHTIVDDVRHGVRLLAARPLLALTAILTIAAGIGASTAIFSAVNGLILRPMAFGDPAGLAFPYAVNPRSGFMDYPDARLIDAWQHEARSTEPVQAHRPSDATVIMLAGPRIVRAASATHGLLELLRLRPHAGRGFDPDDERPGAPPVVMLGFGFWRSAFGGDRDVIGRDLVIDGVSHTIIGVAPRELVEPLTRDPERDIWRPLRRGTDGLYEAAALIPVVRLRDGATLEGAAAELTAIARRIALERTGAPSDSEVRLLRPENLLAPHVRLSLFLLLGAVGLVLLIGCANVANLLLARSVERENELAVRAALGASRWRLLRQLLVETLLLGAAGGVVGYLLAQWGFDVIVALRPESLRDLDRVHIDGRVTLFAAATALGAALIAGLLPALRASRHAISGTLRSGSVRVLGSAWARRYGAVLIGAEVALALVLLTGAGLLVRTFVSLQHQPLAYEPDGRIAVVVDLPSHRYRGEQRAAFHEQLRAAMASLSAIRSAHLAHTVPPVYALNSPELRIDGIAVDTTRLPPYFTANFVDPGYFDALGIRLLRGRAMVEGESDIVVVSESFVRRYLGDREPLGRRIRFDDSEPWQTIIGVAPDIPAQGLASVDPVPQLHYPVGTAGADAETLLLRTDASPEVVREAVESVVQRIDPTLPIRSVESLSEMLSASLDGPRFNLLLMGVLAGMAVLLAAGGLYGVVSVSVGQRTHEVGVRRALGATDAGVTLQLVREGMRPALIGLIVGGIVALAVTQVMERLLYGLSPRDPLTLAAVALLLAGVALLASWIPARRATRVEPLVALRSD